MLHDLDAMIRSRSLSRLPEDGETLPTPDPDASGATASRAGDERGVLPNGGPAIPTGIAPFDERTGGLARGGTYLIAGPPGPVKLVTGLHVLRAGLSRSESAVLLTNADAESMLEVAGVWGVGLRESFRRGALRIVGFRDDFELRAMRTTEPQTIFEELDGLVGEDADRILVDPATFLLGPGIPRRLERAFLEWASGRAATVLATLPVERPGRLPLHADRLLQANAGVVLVSARGGDLYQLELVHARPRAGQDRRPITVEMVPGEGLRTPGASPARRKEDHPTEDRSAPDPDRLLLLSLGGDHAEDLEAWARGRFSTEVASDAVSAITRLQSGARFGGIVVHARRSHVRNAIRACRALRPLTAGALVFATDDPIRSTDRTRMLEAGAHDCLSGGLDFGELGTRLRHAREQESRRWKPVAEESAPMPEGGSVTVEALTAEVSDRARSRDAGVFTLLRFPSGGGVLEAVRAEIRADQGDLVADDGTSCFVLLQGARRSSASAFVDRVRRRPGGPGEPSAELDVDVWDHPGERAAIERVLASSHPDRAPGELAAPGDPDESS